MSEERLVPVFIPTLVSILYRHEQQKGAPLTEEEVVSIRNKSVAIMLRTSAAVQMAERRGYQDIDPEHCWSLWQRVREQLKSSPAS